MISTPLEAVKLGQCHGADALALSVIKSSVAILGENEVLLNSWQILSEFFSASTSKNYIRSQYSA